MSDRFHPVTMEQLTGWVFDELEGHGSVFGIPRELFFTPAAGDRFRLSVYGQPLETPFGAAAGPHTQMAQNLIAAWLVGGRFLELKTVQTLDELDVNKPCIDAQDEGYNVEWSQELKVFESFDEYLRAWVLIHALHHALGLPGERPGMIFNMSVGYNLEGILRPNVQWYLDAMADASAHLPAYLDLVAARYPGIRDVEVPARLSDNVTLSTMHGCPPGEIEQITAYLMSERGLHTSVKCNPTLLGADGVRGILHDDLGFTDVPVPDQAFEHDLRWEDAVPMFDRLRAVAADEGVTFGLKLSNTLEVENWRSRFPGDETMYLSGRPLHAITTNLALKVAEQYDGGMLLSFAGGADCFNVADLLRSGLTTVTVCSDLLKSGGYLRMLQYFEELDSAMDAVGATGLEDYTVKSAGGGTTAAAGVANLADYAARVRADRRFVKSTFDTTRSKTVRRLDLFDCIEAPCVDECPVDQAVPQYMEAVRTGDYATAVAITRGDNPMPSILGHVCDHLCEHTCIRTHYDEPLAIREIKRFIMSREEAPAADPAGTDGRPPVAVIGAGPCGLAAAERLAAAGHPVTVFEQHPYAGGMVGGAIPAYRLPQAVIDQDLAPLERLGVDFRFGQAAGVDFTLEGLRADGYEDVVVAVGAQLAKRLGLDGEDADGVLDGISFLRSVREGDPIPIGSKVAVIGAGDTAMDCARSAARLGADVTVVYRRTIDQMPADREEIRALLDEGVHVEELSLPVRLVLEDGALAGLECRRMEFRGDRDASGRKIPHEVEGSEHVLPFDTMLLAISQHSVLDFFGDAPPALTRRGYLATDPVTLETSIPGIYAGGDVGGDGPASIVKAAADGKAIAAAISGRHAPPPEPHRAPADRVGLLSRRSRREWRVPVPHVPVAEREGFEPVVLTYSEEEARQEASRCLDCQTICSICVGVCPNLAILTYESEPVAVDVPVLALGGEPSVAGTEHYAVGQQLQVAVLTDFCNECGNCETFCPTAGAPYRDKPRLYLDRADFEAQTDNAFMLFRGETPAIEGRYGGETHRVEVNGRLSYRSPRVRAEIDPGTWEVLEADGGGDGEVSLRPAADLWVLLQGLAGSAPFLPGHEGGGTRVPHPGYQE
ncbi:MAG: putative selenate reductase subunit YgfK [Actinobacteria bacterium]|nr:putative selenate reductase subunit YgfK [Actinomycetota bacterium]